MTVNPGQTAGFCRELSVLMAWQIWFSWSRRLCQSLFLFTKKVQKRKRLHVHVFSPIWKWWSIWWIIHCYRHLNPQSSPSFTVCKNRQSCRGWHRKPLGVSRHRECVVSWSLWGNQDKGPTDLWVGVQPCRSLAHTPILIQVVVKEEYHAS